MSTSTAFRVTAALAALVLAAACGESGSTASGDGGAYDRPVEMVVPFGPGGGADAVGRALSADMAEPLGVDIPVVNVPGATGSTGMTKMLGGEPGETIAVLSQDTMTTAAAGNASYKLDDIRGVCRLQSMPSAILVRTGDYDNWKDVAAQARSKVMSVATVGTKSVDDIVLAALSEKVGTKFRAVPFAEPSERYAALLSGDVDLMYEQLGDVRQYLDSGQFTPVMIVGKDAPKAFADVPTASDLGLPEEVVLPQFRGIVASAEATDDQVDELESACHTGSETEKMGTFQEEVYADDDSYQGAAEFDEFLDEQSDLIAEQLTSYGIKDDD